MTDMQEVTNMLMRSKIKFESETNTITVEGGYIGFYTVFEFDSQSKALISIKAYE